MLGVHNSKPPTSPATAPSQSFSSREIDLSSQTRHISAMGFYIQPSYKNLFVKSNLSGDFIVLNRELVNDLKKEGLWNQDMLDQLKYFDGEKHRRRVGVLDEARRVCRREAATNQLTDIDGIPEHLKQKHLTVFAIGHDYLIDAAARRQKWIDQSQSVNLFLAAPETGCECPQQPESHMYRKAWTTGLKTTYYLRTLQASNIEKSTVGTKTYSDAEKAACSIEAMRNGEECEARQ